MDSAVVGMKADTFRRCSGARERAFLCVWAGIFLLSSAPLSSQQYFDHYYRYSVWPPSFWSHEAFLGGEIANWESSEGALHAQVDILDRASFTDLTQLGRQTFSSWKVRYATIKLTPQRSPVPDWLSPFLSLRRRKNDLNAETQLISYRENDGRQGWLLLWRGAQWYYRVYVTGPPLLKVEQTAAMLSTLDSFALLDQGLWHPGAVSSLYQALMKKDELDSVVLPFNGERARWRANEWREYKNSSEAQISREYLLVTSHDSSFQHGNYQIERYYQLVFRHNFPQFQPLLKLLSRRPVVLQTSEGAPTPKSPQEATERNEDENKVQYSKDKEVYRGDLFDGEDSPGAEEKTGEDGDLFSYLNDEREVDAESSADDLDSLFAGAGAENDEDAGEMTEDDMPDSPPPTNEKFVESEDSQRPPLSSLPLAVISPSSSVNGAADDAGTAESEEGGGSSRGGGTGGRRLLKALETESDDPSPEVINFLYVIQDKNPVKRENVPARFQAPLANFWRGNPDLDTLLLASAIILSHMGYNTLILFSAKHNYSLLGVEMGGAGARVRWFSRNYLLFDLGKRIKAGWVPRHAAQLEDWQAVSFSGYRPPQP